jgi:hypothetical protein
MEPVDSKGEYRGSPQSPSLAFHVERPGSRPIGGVVPIPNFEARRRFGSYVSLRSLALQKSTRLSRVRLVAINGRVRRVVDCVRCGRVIWLRMNQFPGGGRGLKCEACRQ